MERRRELRAALRDGTVAEGGTEQAIRFLAASEQFSTRSCARCDGLLVNDWCYDLENTGEHIPTVLRCVQCGHRIDPLILQHQLRPSVAKDHMRRVKPKLSVSHGAAE